MIFRGWSILRNGSIDEFEPYMEKFCELDYSKPTKAQNKARVRLLRMGKLQAFQKLVQNLELMVSQVHHLYLALISGCPRLLATRELITQQVLANDGFVLGVHVTRFHLSQNLHFELVCLKVIVATSRVGIVVARSLGCMRLASQERVLVIEVDLVALWLLNLALKLVN